MAISIEFDNENPDKYVFTVGTYIYSLNAIRYLNKYLSSLCYSWIKHPLDFTKSTS